MSNVKEDKAREHRITYEAVVDAYDSNEQAMGWYYYLENKLVVPFTATCAEKRTISPLRLKDTVQVIGMAPEEECEAEMFVLIKWDDDELAVPLSQLEPEVNASEETKEAIGDWHYWVARGYEFD
jgi:hypothetical protein